jgi:Protein of unknown function (DUF2934)
VKSSHPNFAHRIESSHLTVVSLDGKRHERDEGEIDATISEAEWRTRVAERAYYLAEKRAFAPGGEVQDWLAAEHDLACYLVSVRYGLK